MKHDIVIETPGWPHNNIQFVGSDNSNVVYQCTVTLAEMQVWHEVIIVIVGEPQKCKFTSEAVCCCCNVGFDMRAIYTVPVDQVLPPSGKHAYRQWLLGGGEKGRF